MILCFELSMPGRGSWNGGWSGEDSFYAICKTFPNSIKSTKKCLEIVEKGYYSYSWSDGWRAAVTVKQVDSKQAKSIKSKSKGFCGYDWMVDSIINYGAIYASHEIPSRRESV